MKNPSNTPKQQNDESFDPIKVATQNYPIIRLISSDYKNAMALPYIIGIETQLERYREGYTQLMAEKYNQFHMYNLLHDFIVLAEDLATLAVFMKEKGYAHDKHKLWTQVRHHFRHDLRDTQPSLVQAAQTEKRSKYLRMGKFEMRFEPKEEEVKIGERIVRLKDIELYLDWVKSVLDDSKLPPLESLTVDFKH